MNGAFATTACLLAAYLIGSIPFGLIIARWFGGIDIRTVGSGNIGATNVGRALGFRFFVAVFLCDFLKGMLPTLSLPELASRATGLLLPHLPVGVAIAAILGHNFPIYLRFKGGKGVATSLGAVSALDAFASVSAATGFTFSILITRYVSMSSIVGGLTWLLAHFARVEKPFARDQIAMTFASFGLMGLLLARHRKNLARIASGTEPKVNLRKKKVRDDRPAGRIAPFVIVGLAVVAGGSTLAIHTAKRPEVDFGPYHAAEATRVATGHQRAERLAFADHGRLLAATCPRYNRAMLYRVTETHQLDLVRDIPLGGRPVAIVPTLDRLIVLIRPTNDARHVEEGWYETFDLQGQPVGSRVRVGFYPDDLAITPDGRSVIVLASGRGESEPHRPMPSMALYDLATSKETARIDFDQPGDDPCRLALATDGSMAAVSLKGRGGVAWISLADSEHPRIIARKAWPANSSPDSLQFDHQNGLMIADEVGDKLWLQARPEAEPTSVTIEGGISDVAEYPGSPAYPMITSPFDSSLVFLTETGESRLPIKGRGNLAATRPFGLTASADRGLIAVSNRSGGSIHLVVVGKAAGSH